MFVRKKRGAARGSKKANGRKPARRLPRPRLPEGLQQRHLDIIGLLLIASGVYLTFVLFFGWEGGKVGYGVETGLEYLFGEVGARIATVLTLVVGGVLVTGTSISSILRGLGRGTRHLLLGGRDAAQTAIQQRDARREQRTVSDLETGADATDVMSTYPDEEAFAPTVALGGAEEAEEPEPITEDFEELEEPDEEEAPDVAPKADEEPVALTPQGNKRGVTTSEQIDYRPPPSKALERGKADSGPDPETTK